MFDNTLGYQSSYDTDVMTPMSFRYIFKDYLLTERLLADNLRHSQSCASLTKDCQPRNQQ